MRKDLQTRQEQMRMRQMSSGHRITPMAPVAPVRHPVDYSRSIEYSSEVSALHYFPRVNGVYLLTEDGQFYVGQSVDVYARFSSHRLRPISCHFHDPKGAVLAAVPLRDDWTWTENARVRLNAEARFVAAALSLNLPLTNALSTFKRNKLAGMFADIGPERERIRLALKILC